MSQEKTNQNFIFIHNQDLLLDYEKNKKFKNLKNYTYVFVGFKDCNKIEKLKNVIIARNLKDNLEIYHLFTAFTGWYMLWKNNLINSDYVTFMEYDVILNENFENSVSNLMKDNYDLIGYIIHPMKMYHYIQHKDWIKTIFPAIKKVHNVDVEEKITSIINSNPNSVWSATNNVTFKKEVFDEYMKWFEPLINEIKHDEYCGHAQERAISFFYTIKNKKVAMNSGVLKHFQLNSHGTQGHKVDYEVSHKKLIKNEL